MKAVVVDAGVGNLGNVARALAHLGAEARVTSEPTEVAAARCLVLPGVGAFGPPRERLRGALEAALGEALAQGAWLLGICVGYQLLFDEGEELGACDGLGLLPGKVRRLPGTVPLPHMGWNRLREIASHPLLAGLEDGDLAYFVHGYAPEEVPRRLWLATVLHGRPFPAVAGRGRVLGTQFHPEKSGAVGLRLLGNFLALAGAAEGSLESGGAGEPHGEATSHASRPGGREDVEAVVLSPPSGAWRRPRVGSGRGEGPAVAATFFPALDLRGGRVVRLVHGEDSRRTDYGDDPEAVLAAWGAAGAAWAHVVDLDAAFGEPPQLEVIRRLLAHPGRPAIQLGGGLRTREAVEAALELGCERAVVGSLVARDFPLFRALALEHPGRLVPAIDVDGTQVRVDGWRAGAAPWRELAAALAGLPCPAVLVTDIRRDGTLAGPNLELACDVARAGGMPALVSGGVRALADLQAAAGCPEVAGVVVGKALHEGAFTVAEALAALAGAATAERAAPARTPASTPAGAPGPLTELTARVIPCLDVAEGRVVKGVRFRDLADQGDPAEAARRLADEGADEIVFLDVSASHEARGTRLEWVERVAREVFVPLTVGGGVASVEDARALLLAGADKVAVNSAPVARPELLAELAGRFGSQCVVLSVDARRRPGGGWEVLTHGGRRETGREAVGWLAEGVERGAGEVLLTSMDGDGTRGGYDLELVAAAARRVPVPVIASGGAGTVEHLSAALAAGAAAVLAASIFHQRTFTVGEVKARLEALGHRVRREEPRPGLPGGSGDPGRAEDAVGRTEPVPAGAAKEGR